MLQTSTVDNKPETIQEPQELSTTRVIPPEIQTVWTQVLDLLSKKLRKPSYETWIKPTSLIEISNNEAVIAVKNEFTRNFILQTYQQELSWALKEVQAQSLGIRIIIDPDLEPSTSEATEQQTSFAELKPSVQTKPSIKIKSKLQKQMSFETYAQARFNKSAITFARATSQNHGGVYSSLFLQSEPGLGKTHLLNAIGNEILLDEPDTRIKYTRAEDFANELIISIQRNNTQEFRNQYRNLDLLLFDDFQFLENKKTCQEEFLYTFEALVNAGAKVIIASQLKLDELKISKNLQNKIKIALQSEILQPSFEERLMILALKAQQASLEMSSDQFEVIARKCPDSVRELEAALYQISAHTAIAGEDLDDELISRLFGGIGDEPQFKGLSIKMITDSVAKYFSIKSSALIGKSRLQDISRARHIAIYLSHQLLGISYSRIGEHFNGRKHSSIIHSLKVIETQLQSKLPSAAGLKTIIEDIKSQLA